MAQLIDAAVASKPDGLVVSIPDADALSDSIKAAVDAGIPVISMNSGSDVAKKLGIRFTWARPSTKPVWAVGELASWLLKGPRMPCVNQEVGNAALDLRCKGFTDAMEKLAAKSRFWELSCPIQPMPSKIAAALMANPDVDSILTLGPTGSAPALAALQEGDLVGKIKLATFDLSPEVLQAIEKGDMLFAIDQQQYLQGYLPIVLLTLYKENLNTVANDVLMTGPGFVTKDTAARVIELAKAGTR
ncbi:MAG: substrate-binding domain-containing protein [Anaerolineae bacterium]